MPADTRIHDIRHGSASHLIADGDIATASRILGHSNAYVTLAIYGHMLPHASSRAMARIGAVYDAASATLRDEEEGATSGDAGIRGRDRVGEASGKQRITRRAGRAALLHTERPNVGAHFRLAGHAEASSA
jgi:hypothetical protein